MAESNQGSSGLNDVASTLSKLQELLKSKDDTSRFVGLALLKSVLDNGQLGQDPEKVRILWESISSKFLDRLLNARRSEKIGASEARDMVDLAVAVLHTFSILLPEKVRVETRFIQRIEPLLKSLIQSSPQTTKLILQTLLTVASQVEGALHILAIEDISPLTEISVQEPLALDILNFTWTNASTTNFNATRKSIDRTIPRLLTTFYETDAVTLLTFLGDLIARLHTDALPRNPKWIAGLVSTIRKLVISKPTLAGRAAYAKLASALLQVYPVVCPPLLFKDNSAPNVQNKPFSYLFLNLLLIDIRSSLPSLLAKLNSNDYPAIAQRLSAAFDVISSFIGYLVKSLDDEIVSPDFNMPPDLLLRLRKDIAETMSLTIEYIRDRWDASIAGASGLHPSARTGTAATSEGTRLTLTWESMKDDVTTDPLILASIRALAIWIREDENENLRHETTGLMDVFIELYKISSESTLDFRYPVLLAIEGIMATDGGVEAFLEQDGWVVIFRDVELSLRNIQQSEDSRTRSADAARGIEVVRVLLAVVDDPSTMSPQESWMQAVTTTASIKLATEETLPIVLELQIAMLQLSTALMAKAATGMQKRYLTSNAALSGLRSQLTVSAKNLKDKKEASELLESLEDVSMSLDNLRMTG